MPLNVQVYSTDLPRVVRRLREAGSPLVIRAEIRGGLTAVGPAARAAIASAARDIPSRGRAHTGLRLRIARAASARTVNEVTGPALIVGIRNDVMGTQRSLPPNIEIGHWRHPVYGNKNVWVAQTSQRGWFSGAITSRVVPLMELSMAKTAHAIARSFVK